MATLVTTCAIIPRPKASHKTRPNGREVGAVWVTASKSGSPMTCLADGKQYIVVAIGGGNYSGQYVAFMVPR
jgi:quinoprotein glucose dehydrogenase